MKKLNKISGFVDVQELFLVSTLWLVFAAIALGTVWLMRLPPDKPIHAWCLLAAVHLMGFWFCVFFRTNRTLLDRTIFTEQGICTKRFGKTLCSIDYHEVKEFGIKWRMDSPLSMTRSAVKAYYIYFAKSELTPEARRLIGTVRQGKGTTDVVFCADTREKMVPAVTAAEKLSPVLHAQPVVTPLVCAHIPEFAAVCEQFTFDGAKNTEIDGVTWTAGGITVRKKSDRSDFERRLIRTYSLHILGFAAYVLGLAVVLPVIL